MACTEAMRNEHKQLRNRWEIEVKLYCTYFHLIPCYTDMKLRNIIMRRVLSRIISIRIKTNSELLGTG